jgi:hypothetical protein
MFLTHLGRSRRLSLNDRLALQSDCYGITDHIGAAFRAGNVVAGNC